MNLYLINIFIIEDKLEKNWKRLFAFYETIESNFLD